MGILYCPPQCRCKNKNCKLSHEPEWYYYYIEKDNVIKVWFNNKFIDAGTLTSRDKNGNGSGT